MLIDPTHNFEWLLEGEPWVKYRTYIDLLHQPESDPICPHILNEVIPRK
jgi:hypothetical protein